ncbi:MAG: hypothetical protein QNJ31_05640 [Candidatus Caenarcaniphilales bacterium]|nr:hypothetical protein [Candidatus Caenarcaniphilales bacterium]
MEYQVNQISNSFDFQFSGDSNTSLQLNEDHEALDSEQSNNYIQLVLQDLFKDPNFNQLSFSFFSDDIGSKEVIS